MIEIKKEWEGRCGTNLVPIFFSYLDGKLVATHRRRWISEEVAKAVEAGHISADGDTLMSFARWAATNAPELYVRLPENL